MPTLHACMHWPAEMMRRMGLLRAAISAASDEEVNLRGGGQSPRRLRVLSGVEGGADKAAVKEFREFCRVVGVGKARALSCTCRHTCTIIHANTVARTHTHTPTCVHGAMVHVWMVNACMHAYIHTYTHVHTRTHTYTHVHTRTHTYTPAHLHNMYTRIHTQVRPLSYHEIQRD